MILDEISREEAISQRELSRKLNIALGLVNSYIKNLVAKGYVKIRNIPPKRYAYYLTPQGFSEKSRLTYEYLQNYTNLFRTARRDFRRLFVALRRGSSTTVVFAGIDELSEIAFLSLQEVGLTLEAALDSERAGERFFNREIRPFSALPGLEGHDIIITTFEKKEAVYRALLEAGTAEERIHSLSRADDGNEEPAVVKQV